MESIHLAYLIEIAIILNFALRELNIKDLINVRIETEKKIKSETKSDTIDEVYTKNCSERLRVLINGGPSYFEDGVKVDVWNNRYLRWCYKWITTKKASILSAISIIINIVMLYVIVIYHADKWFYFFLLLITITIIHPLILVFSSNKIRDFLLGENDSVGKIQELINNLTKSVKENEKKSVNIKF